MYLNKVTQYSLSIKDKYNNVAGLSQVSQVIQQIVSIPMSLVFVYQYKSDYLRYIAYYNPICFVQLHHDIQDVQFGAPREKCVQNWFYKDNYHLIFKCRTLG